MKFFAIGYAMFAMVAFFLQIILSDFFQICEFNRDACLSLTGDAALNALLWPGLIPF